MTSKKNKSNNGGLEDVIEKIFIGLWAVLRICSYGFRSLLGSVNLWLALSFTFLTLSFLTDGKYSHMRQFAFFYLGTDIPQWIIWTLTRSHVVQVVLLTLMIWVPIFFAQGLRVSMQYRFFQRAIDRIGLKSGLSEVPKVVAFEKVDGNRTKVIVQSYGVGLNKFETQKDSLIAGFRQNVESIGLANDKGKIVISLCKHDLSKKIGFDELYEHMNAPYSFIIGQSATGPLIQPIQSLPHMLVSGATGGGKSVFVKTTILSLLKSSNHIQFYLLDLKRGVEVKEFAVLPNVKTVKSERESISVLGLLVEEMNRRYEYLEKNNLTTIDPKKDKMDLIVVCIDEAAALFGKKNNEKAREYISELARLARASGIHLIPSTQKPVKAAIDTETLDNLPGRMTFRMISSAASNVAMGGSLARKLPPIKGRAIWTNGSEHTEVQAPFISTEQLREEIEMINDEFKSGERVNFGDLLSSKSDSVMEGFTHKKDTDE